jgi:parallel beta-helix repeat protein
MTTLKHVFVAILLLLLPFSVWSATFYISSSQGNDSWSGTLQAPNSDSSNGPKQSLSAALSLIGNASPGDKILFKRGDRWTGTISRAGNGTSSARIVVGAYGSGNRPILTTSGEIGINIGSGQYTTFEGLELYSTSSMNNRNVLMNFAQGGTAHHINFDDCYFHDYDHGGPQYSNNNGIIENSIIENMQETNAYSQGIFIANDGFTLRNNTFINNGVYDPVGFDHSVYVSGATNLLIENNIMRDAVDGIKIRRGSNVTVRGNTIYNMDMGGVSVGGDSSSGFDTALIEGNRIYNCPNPILILSQSGNQTALTNNVTIRDNVVFSNFGEDTIPSFKGVIDVSNGVPATNIRIYNNTVFSHRKTSRSSVGRAISIEASNMSGSMIKNNIIYNENTSVPALYVDSDVHSNIDIDNNIYVDKASGPYISVGGTNYSSLSAYKSAFPSKERFGQQGTPQLEDPLNPVQALRDFRLKSTDTLAMDKAALINANEDDIVGIARGDTPDIGAYQYGNPPAPPMLFSE